MVVAVVAVLVEATMAEAAMMAEEVPQTESIVAAFAETRCSSCKLIPMLRQSHDQGRITS